MDTQRVEAELHSLERDSALDEESNFHARSLALDRVDFIEKIAVARRNDPLARRATHLRQHLEAINRHLFRRVRADIRSQGFSPAALRRLLDGQTAYSPRIEGFRHLRYEPLDELVAGLFLGTPVPEETVEREPEMVHYEPTPASVILELVDRIHFGPDDRFCDLGAGLGQVVFLVNLLSGVPARGVEVEPVYAAYARRTGADLGLAGVEFVQADAREAYLDDATVFFLFTPFWGSILQTVLGRLYALTRRHPIRIGAYGSCARQIGQQRWLRPLSAGDDEYTLVLFESL